MELRRPYGIERSDEEAFEMSNGCICCTVRGDLMTALWLQLMQKEELLFGILK